MENTSKDYNKKVIKHITSLRAKANLALENSFKMSDLENMNITKTSFEINSDIQIPHQTICEAVELFQGLAF